jgi:lauroyl/myristoyl acyltransferase
LVCDRDVTGGGMEVEFFGEKARMMGGPAALAVQTGAALMPVILWFEGDHLGARFLQTPGVSSRSSDAWQDTYAVVSAGTGGNSAAWREEDVAEAGDAGRSWSRPSWPPS